MACPIEIQIPPIEEEIPNLDELPIEVVARHEAGHALAAHRCGGRAQRIVFGTTASGHLYGRAFWEIPPDEHQYLLVLSAGPLALFLHDCPSAQTYRDFVAWIGTDEGFLRAVSGAADWREILRRTNQPEGHGLYDFLVRAIEPYFDETCQLLANSREQLDALTSLLLAHPPGLGPRALKRFFAGKPSSPWATRFDRMAVRWASAAERRAADIEA